ncbi:MAG: VWA domain-containing protein [Candidatus Gastranaerophilales bacterium]|nr:VWA domain-containing protein [Candidatus Gastranaerophilales bacterium]
MKINIFILTILAFFVNCPPIFGAPNYQIYTPKSYTSSAQTQKFDENSKILFIVDFSNSMNEELNGKKKINIAMETMASILPRIDPKVQIGMRVYGHKTGLTYLQGCMASKLAVPFAQNNAQAVLNAMYTTKATGWTPITYSLKQAVNNDFMAVSGKKHIILLTDGGENCDESPCTYAIELMKTRDDISIDVIAFDLYDQEANNQLKCTALATRGKFYSAGNSEDLSSSLFDSLGIDKNVHGTVKIGE